MQLNQLTVVFVTAVFVILSSPQQVRSASRAEAGGAAHAAESTSRQFHPRNAPYGGFGGAACEGRTKKVPVVFIHGNGDSADGWVQKASDGGPSPIEEFNQAGYGNCDLFGVTFLSAAERERPQGNFHKPEKALLIAQFIEDVLAYTGAMQVDLVTHSLGVTMSLYAIQKGQLWARVRKFVGIAGAMRGLNSCAWAGPVNVASKTCGSENVFNDEVFGFFPDGVGGVRNSRMGDGAEYFAQVPKIARTRFYTISAGAHDQIVCGLSLVGPDCAKSSTFDPFPNVVSQVEVGHGALAQRYGKHSSADDRKPMLGRAMLQRIFQALRVAGPASLAVSLACSSVVRVHQLKSAARTRRGRRFSVTTRSRSCARS